MKLKKSLAGIIMLSTMLMSGCSTYDAVQVKPKKLDSNYSYYLLNPPLYEGDIVQYKLKDGSRNTVTVQKTTPQSLLTSTGQVVPFDDMVSLDKKDISKGKTAAAVGAGAGATAIVMIAVFAVTLGAGFAAILAGG
ncbi:hypothetical protein D0720_003961 [Escherichia albertii]|nr:hypothetical protein [Escherichia albertii]EFO1266266.1 hypothetical protein [Escherichia albertii]